MSFQRFLIKLAWVILSVVSYLALFFLLYPIVNTQAMMFVVIIPITTVIVFGLVPGIITSLLTLPIATFVFSFVVDNPLDQNIRAGILGTVAYTITTFMIGKMIQLNQRLKKEAIKNKEMYAQLKYSERRLQDIINASSDWIWETDPQGKYTYVSKGVERILGYSPKELIGKSPFELMEANASNQVAKMFAEVIEKKKPITDLENLNLHKNGKHVLLLTNGVPILDREGNLLGYRGVDKDITKKKKEELIEKQQLEEMQKLNELTTNRELRMVELKEEIARLKEKHGEE